MADYTVANLEQRAAEAKQRCRSYLEAAAEQYAKRQWWRQAEGLPAIAIAGYGRAGKDTAADFLAHVTRLKFAGSCSKVVLPLIASMVGISEEQAYQERHQHRSFWFSACNALRQQDAGLLIRLSLARGDIVAGIRSCLELDAAAHQHLVDMTIWVDNNRVTRDDTVEFGPNDCDLLVPNHGSLRDFYARLRRLAILLDRGYRHSVRPS